VSTDSVKIRRIRVARWIAWTRLNVTLYAYCLSSSLLNYFKIMHESS
jgi:hypothetical protein